MTRRPLPGNARPGVTKSSGALVWLSVGVLVLVVLGGLVGAALITGKADRYNETTLCNVKGPSAVTAILIDATDGINAVQRRAVLNRLNRINRQLVANERVDVFEVSPTADPLTPIFSMCRPVSADETSELTGNRRLAQKRFNETFNPQLEAALMKLLDQRPAPNSPIIEAVRAAVVASFLATDVPDTAPRRLVIVSDMLQHSENISHYEGLPEFDAFKSSPAYEQTASDLTGAEVTVLYLKRPAAADVQGRRHADFWVFWFDALGADDVNSIPIEG